MPNNSRWTEEEVVILTNAVLKGGNKENALLALHNNGFHKRNILGVQNKLNSLRSTGKLPPKKKEKKLQLNLLGMS